VTLMTRSTQTSTIQGFFCEDTLLSSLHLIKFLRSLTFFC
jgi:hypothetical protein